MPKNLDSPFSLIPVRFAESMVTVGGEAQRSKANVREASGMKKNAVFIVEEEAEMRKCVVSLHFVTEPVSDKSRQNQPRVISQYSVHRPFHFRGETAIVKLSVPIITTTPTLG